MTFWLFICRMGGLQHWRGDLRYRQFFVARQDVCRRQLNEKRVIHRGQWKFITRTSSAFLINWATMSNTRKCVGLLQNYFWIAYLPMWENQSKPRFISLLRSRHATLLLLLCWKVFFFFQGKIHQNFSTVQPFLTGTGSGSSFKHYKIQTAFDLCKISKWVSSKFFPATYNCAPIYFRHSWVFTRR